MGHQLFGGKIFKTEGIQGKWPKGGTCSAGWQRGGLKPEGKPVETCRPVKHFWVIFS